MIIKIIVLALAIGVIFWVWYCEKNGINGKSQL